jgi:hypothetical protein
MMVPVPVAVRLTSVAGSNEGPSGRGVCHHGERDGEAREQGGSDNGQSEDGLHKTMTIVLDRPHMRQNGPTGTEADA